MNKIFSYQSFLKSAILIVFIGQLCTNVISYCHWALDIDSETIELVYMDDMESEEEEKEEKKEKEEKEDKVQMDILFSRFEGLSSIAKALNGLDAFSVHHPEIVTPPPKYFFS